MFYGEFMSISRRDFFAETFVRAIESVPKLVPNSVSGLLGIKEEKKLLTPEEAAFSLASRCRKRSITDSRTPTNLPDNRGRISKGISDSKYSVT